MPESFFIVNAYDPFQNGTLFLKGVVTILKKISKTLLITSGLLSVGITALTTVSYLLTKRLVRIALDREAPKSGNKSRYRISGISASDPQSKKILDAAQRLKNSVSETVETEAPDGEKLTGHLFRNKNAKRIIIAMHGWRSSWNNDFGMIFDFWRENDCHILYAEQRGHNSSGGRYMGFGMIERHDCRQWITWVCENVSNTLPIYLAGISMGASTVLMTSGLDLSENVCGIMSDCGFTSAHDIWKHVTENNLHLSYQLVSYIADSMCRKKINIGTRDYSTKDALSKTKIPILLIHGTNDKFVPVSMTYENYLACNSEKELLIVPGAGHGRSYITDKYRYEKAVLEFWNKYDSFLKDM